VNGVVPAKCAGTGQSAGSIIFTDNVRLLSWWKGLGQGLLKDALERTVRAADIGGLRAMLVHTKDDSARVFYEHFNFEPSPTDPYHLFILLKDLKRMLR
jgi:GNAT superfamily N-acetyltransferase